MRQNGGISKSSAVQNLVRRAANLVRASQWWEYKFVPTICVLYAGSLAGGISLADHWDIPLVLIVMLAPGAIYVSLLNDWFDRRSDAAAGKANRMIGVAAPVAMTALSACLIVGLGAAAILESGPWTWTAYAGSWIAFSLYSVTPIRLKDRGIAGVVGDASGSHLFPALLATALLVERAGASLDPAWIGAIAAWSLGYGLRGIVNHQLADEAGDRASESGSFVIRAGRASAIHLVRFGALPLELGGLGALVIMLPGSATQMALAAYGLFTVVKLVRYQMRLVAVDPIPRFLLFLHDFYDVFWPFALLVALGARDTAQYWLLAAHLVFFPTRWREIVRDLWRFRLRSYE